MRRHPVSFLATTKPDEAKLFYGGILGLRLIEDSPYALVFAQGDHTLRVQIVGQLSPAQHTVHGWVVSEIEDEVTELASKGVVFQTFSSLEQSDSGIWTSPDGNKIAWFHDPCGNILSLTQYDKG